MTSHSIGGIDAQYMVYHNPNYYSAMIVLSGYSPNVDITTIKEVPTLGYVGHPDSGESSNSYNYMVGKFTAVFSSSNVKVYNTSHGNVPKKAFTEDINKDNKSDLVEWILRH